MNAHDLIKSWPTLSSLTPCEILATPGWRYPVEFDGAAAELTRAAGAVAPDELFLELAFDGEPHVLGLGDSVRYPDLHLLWGERRKLPEALLTALVEKEAGAVLQLLENLSRCEIKIRGIAGRPSAAERFAFDLRVGGESLPLTLDLPTALIDEMGRLDCLDPAHPFVREQVRPIRACYTLLPLDPAEIADVKSGDYLVLGDFAPEWLTEVPDDGKLRLMDADENQTTLARFADERLPVPPAPDAVRLGLFVGKRPVFAAVLSGVGTARAVRVEPM